MSQSPEPRPETPLYRDPLGTIYNNFGVFRGKEVGGVYQYLGIRYAQVATQLSAPELIHFYDEVVDCTKYGYVGSPLHTKLSVDTYIHIYVYIYSSVYVY